MILRKICCSIFLALIVISCGGKLSNNDDTKDTTEVAQHTPALSIKAEVCTKRIEGPQGKILQLFVRNLNDFTWSGATFIGKDFSDQAYQKDVDSWPPENIQNGGPFTSALEFKILVVPKGVSRRNYGQPLTTFSLLQTVSIAVEDPISSEWSGAVIPCQ